MLLCEYFFCLSAPEREKSFFSSIHVLTIEEEEKRQRQCVCVCVCKSNIYREKSTILKEKSFSLLIKKSFSILTAMAEILVGRKVSALGFT